MRPSPAGIVSVLAMLGQACGTTPQLDIVNREREIDRVLETLLAPPTIQTEPGFTATVLVPPGELYDPLSLIPPRSQAHS